MRNPDDQYVWRLIHDGSLIFRNVQAQSPLMKTGNVEPRVFFVQEQGWGTWGLG